MAGLLKSTPPRATRQSDAQALSRATKSTVVTPTIKGRGGLYDKIATISAVVTTKLGKYADKYLVLRTEQEVYDYFNKIKAYGKGAIDTETSSLDPITCTLAGVCLYVPGQKAAYIPMHHVSYVTGIESANQISDKVVKECLESCNEKGVKWAMHNSKFDTRVVRNQLGVDDLPCFWDTQLAACCLNENESHKLKDLYSKYCSSDEADSLKYDTLFEGIPFTLVPISIGYLYAAGDPIKTWELMEFQKQFLNEERLPGPYNVFRNIEMPLVPVVADMEDTGIGFDHRFAQKLSEKYNKQLKEKEEKFYSVLKMYSSEIAEYRRQNPSNKLSDPININSPIQIAIVLYDIMGLTSPDKKSPRGTGEEIISELDVPIAKALLDYRETAKLLSTYIDKMPVIVNPKTGRIHCSFHQYGAVTGRFSSSDPNMQNIPSHNKEIRQMFTAREGYVLISCDFSQQEPRTLAFMSGDEHLIQAYKDGKDIYAWIAEKIYNVPYDECKEFRSDGTKNPEGKKRRDSVKSIILGIMYGRGAKAISEQLGCSVKEAQRIVDLFFKTFPKVKQWITRVINDAKFYGYVETAWGRKRRLPDVQLEPFEFIIKSVANSTFDPLAFDNASTAVIEIDPDIKEYYIEKLQKAWGFKDKRGIIQEALDKGIQIKDNGGLIADAERQCVNSIIQGSSADMTKKAMIAIRNNRRLQELNCHIVLQVHDEIIAEAPEVYAKECAEIVSEMMVIAAEEKITVPMKCDATISKTWYGEEVS